MELLGLLENVFLHEGKPGHEIVFVYDAVLVDKRIYERREIQAYEIELDARFTARWRKLEEIEAKKMRLVPEELAELPMKNGK